MYNKKAARYYEQGRALHQKGKLSDSERAYKKAIRISPEFVPAYNNLGNVLLDRGRLKLATDTYRKALNLSPDHPMLLNNLGNALQLQGENKKAVRWLNKAISKNPDYADAYNNLGNALVGLRQLAEAVASYDTAIELQPSSPEFYFNRGCALNDLDKLEAAVGSYEHAIQLRSDYAEAYYNCGIALKDLGRMKESIESWNKVIQLKPDSTETHRNLSTIKTYQIMDPQLHLMETLLENLQRGHPGRAHLYFALSKAYDDLGEYEKSFHALSEGNRLRKIEFNYTIETDSALMTTIKELYINRCPGFGSAPIQSAAIKPLFIVGMPRSGTSLVEQILASHSKVYGAGELDDMNNLWTPTVSNLHDQDFNQDNIESFHNAVNTVRVSYLNTLAALGVPEKIIIDKMPLNFLWIGFILCAFPEARIININRNATATCWSIYKQYFSSQGNGFAYNLSDIVAFYNLYLDLMSFWRQQCPNSLYDICYEFLTENQEEETSRLLAFCDLDWEQQCVDFHKTKRIVKTASAAQVRTKMYQGSSEEWRKYEKHLQPLIDSLGH